MMNATNITLPPTKQRQMYTIAAQMIEAGVPARFVHDVVSLAVEHEGVYDLMVLWAEFSGTDREDVVADLQDMIDDIREVERFDGPEDSYRQIRFDDLKQIADDVMTFKDALRRIVDERGGISHLAELIGMPQPSLSRFFNSASMPRRSTLMKIRDALGLSEVEVNSEWVRG